MGCHAQGCTSVRLQPNQVHLLARALRVRRGEGNEQRPRKQYVSPRVRGSILYSYEPPREVSNWLNGLLLEEKLPFRAMNCHSNLGITPFSPGILHFRAACIGPVSPEVVSICVPSYVQRRTSLDTSLISEIRFPLEAAD